MPLADVEYEHLCACYLRISLISLLGLKEDFGTGYASPSYLQSFPFDKIKIDRSFIKDVGKAGRSLSIVRAVAAMANGLVMGQLRRAWRPKSSETS